MALYEVVLIVQPDLIAEEVDSLVEKISKIVVDGDGVVISKEYWGLKNLSFNIKKSSRGHYLLINVSSDYKVISEINRIMGYNENILRFIILKVEKHDSESLLFASKTAKEFKGIPSSNKELSKMDMILDRVQFDI